MLPIYEYNGTLAGNLLEDTDVVNALTSSDTTKPLSAAQGKALNEKIFSFFKNVTKIVYVTKVFHLSSSNGFFDLYTKDQIFEILGISNVDKWNEKIIVFPIDGDWSSNNAYFGGGGIDPRENQNKILFRYDNATIGSCRINALIVYSEGGEIQ